MAASTACIMDVLRHTVTIYYSGVARDKRTELVSREGEPDRELRTKSVSRGD